MKQILQSLKTGVTEVTCVPCPAIGRGHLLIRSSKTLVSPGTERMLVEFGKASWINKARQQPDKFRMVLDKIKTDGVGPTIDAVLNKLDQPLPLGYCNVGRIVKIGAGGGSSFALGDRIASNGKHAEVVTAPFNLCARVPDSVSDDEAAFTVIGAIALQGIRLVQPSLGESVVVTGLGLVGLITVQLLRAHGCRVLGIDFDHERLSLAKQFGAEVVDLGAHQDPVIAANIFSRGRGVDAVIITASTKSSEPMHQAALMCRKRGRIVLVGVAGLELSRADFFDKEITFQVSCSYGPGRYDPNYEENGNDYPVGYVRWTEQRNFEAVLDMMADGRLNVKPLISHRFSIEDAGLAYQLIGGGEPSLGILLEYPGIELTPEAQTVRLDLSANTTLTGSKKATISFIGAGNYASSVLIPAFKAAGAHLRSVASSGGISGAYAGRKFGFEETTTDATRIFEDAETGAIIVATRHDSHAQFVKRALLAGKHVYVEKPLCLTLGELADIASLRSSITSPPILMIGFNRRFAPQVKKIKQLLGRVSGKKSFVMTVNAGAIPSEHWAQDGKVGGGRIIGEACHFVDLIRFLVGVPIVSWQCMAIDQAIKDTVTIALKFADGSIGTIHYLTNGNKSFPKERLEIFAAGGVLQLDNFRRLTGFGWPGFKKMNLWQQDKGQKACVKEFINAIESCSPSPIPFDEVIEVTRVSIEISQLAS